MPSDLNSVIALLEDSSNPEDAYFSYSVDNTGEYGVINANKEGLRLYAAELLRKAALMEDHQQTGPLLFDNMDWVISETGYDLIIGVQPQHQTRKEIMNDTAVPMRANKHTAASTGFQFLSPGSVFTAVLMCIVGAIIFMATLKALPKLHLWVNIH